MQKIEALNLTVPVIPAPGTDATDQPVSFDVRIFGLFSASTPLICKLGYARAA